MSSRIRSDNGWRKASARGVRGREFLECSMGQSAYALTAIPSEAFRIRHIEAVASSRSTEASPEGKGHGSR